MDLNSIVLVGFYILILIYSIIIHEVAHGFVALWLGDPTAKYADRLNFNPIKHVDLWGSIIVPMIMLLSSGFHYAFGWAKPVPYNPYNLKNQKWGPTLVALGGPGSNILIALVLALVAKLIQVPVSVKAAIIIGVKLGDWSQVAAASSGSFGAIFFVLLAIAVFWNVLLAFFNLIPLPPLDGSKLLFTIFPVSTEKQIAFEQFGFLFLLLFVVLFATPLGYFLNFMLNIFFSIAL